MTSADAKGHAIFLEPRRVVDDYLAMGSIAPEGTPASVVLIAGPVAAGKTTHRKQAYSNGYVLVDAAALFVSLAPDQVLAFPDDLAEPLEAVGSTLARRAIEERRNVVTEIVGMNADAMSQLTEAMSAAGYRTTVEYISCDADVAWQRNISRGENDISAYYAEPFNLRWLTQAALSCPRPPGTA